MIRGIMTIKEMQRASPSRLRLEDYEPDRDPYQNLANAVIAVAADDYRNALNARNYLLSEDILFFFRSQWFRELTELDPEELINLLEDEVDEPLRRSYRRTTHPAPKKKKKPARKKRARKPSPPPVKKKPKRKKRKKRVQHARPIYWVKKG